MIQVDTALASAGWTQVAVTSMTCDDGDWYYSGTGHLDAVGEVKWTMSPLIDDLECDAIDDLDPESSRPLIDAAAEALAEWLGRREKGVRSRAWVDMHENVQLVALSREGWRDR
jgi:hypothetical protein